MFLIHRLDFFGFDLDLIARCSDIHLSQVLHAPLPSVRRLGCGHGIWHVTNAGNPLALRFGSARQVQLLRRRRVALDEVDTVGFELPYCLSCFIRGMYDARAWQIGVGAIHRGASYEQSRPDLRAAGNGMLERDDDRYEA